MEMKITQNPKRKPDSSLQECLNISNERSIELRKKMYRIATNESGKVQTNADLICAVSEFCHSPAELAFTVSIMEQHKDDLSHVRGIKMDMGIANFISDENE